MEEKNMPQFSDDYFRMYGRKWKTDSILHRIFNLLNSHALRYLRAYRKVSQEKDPLGIFSAGMKSISRKYGLALESSDIGKGLYLGHPYNIRVCKHAVIGENCNLNKGAAILPSRENEKAAPRLGSRVWVGVNAVLMGPITIGDNVLIAPNAYVDFDVPSDSIVIGNPAKIIPNRPDATEGYIHHVC